MRHAGIDPEVGLIDLADLVDPRMRVDQKLARLGQGEERIALGDDLAELGAGHQQQIGLPDRVGEGRVGAEPDHAGVARVVVVEQILAAKPDGDGQVVGRGEGPQIVTGAFGPAAAAGQHDRVFRLGQHVAQPRHGVGRRARLYLLIGSAVLDLGALGLHVFGQRQHHRPGPARGRRAEGAVDVFGDPRRIVDLAGPFGELAHHPAEIDLLEGFAFGHAARDLADEDDRRRGILARGVDADARIGRPGAAGDEADAGPPGQLAVGFRHIGRAALLAAGDDADPVAQVEQSIEGRDIALSRNAEDCVDAMGEQRVGQDLAAGPEIAGHVSMNSSTNTVYF